MRFAKVTMLTALFGWFAMPTYAADIEHGKTLATACAACHGAKGISHSPLWPNLAGQKAAYLEKQLKDFRNDVRKDPMMTAMAKSLSDEDIVNLAAYFSSLK
ncbi:MAG: cytochrome c [Alteromonadaceae bacterium]|nr:cytochrome c [Alteromonadaceae bacterium]